MRSTNRFLITACRVLRWRNLSRTIIFQGHRFRFFPHLGWRRGGGGESLSSLVINNTISGVSRNNKRKGGGWNLWSDEKGRGLGNVSWQPLILFPLSNRTPHLCVLNWRKKYERPFPIKIGRSCRKIFEVGTNKMLILCKSPICDEMLPLLWKAICFY